MLYSFPSIENFYQIRKRVELYPMLGAAPVAYRAKVKMHGTHAGVQVRTSGIFAQSRNAMLGVGQGLNMGFADWVGDNHAFFAAMHKGEDFCIFGEWCGPGIMTKTAITTIPYNIWTPFMIQYGATDDANARVVVEPEAIAAIVGQNTRMFVLRWFGAPLLVDWRDITSMQTTAAVANKMVAEVERRDPFVFENFGIDGLGEGLVFYPTTISARSRIEKLMFKAKGEKHKVVRTSAAVQLDPEVVATIGQFVALFVTEARLEQALHEIGGIAEKRQIGPFLAWLCADVRKESKLELAAAQLRWKEVKKAVQAAAEAWFVSKID